MVTISADHDRAVNLCEKDLDSLLDRMVELRLYSPPDTNGSIALNEAVDQPDVLSLPTAAAAAAAAGENNLHAEPSGSSSSTATTSGAEWAEILVGEITSSSSMDEAKWRAARFLEAFQSAVARQVVGDKERVMAGHNAVLRKAVVMQHRRHLQDKGKGEELQGQVAEYRERIRLLELENYAMSLRLRAAQDGCSMSGSFHPEIF